MYLRLNGLLFLVFFCSFFYSQEKSQSHLSSGFRRFLQEHEYHESRLTPDQRENYLLLKKIFETRCKELNVLGDRQLLIV